VIGLCSDNDGKLNSRSGTVLEQLPKENPIPYKGIAVKYYTLLLLLYHCKWAFTHLLPVTVPEV
jgi:hypothetical protein